MPKKSKPSKPKNSPSSNVIMGLILVLILAGVVYFGWQYMDTASEPDKTTNATDNTIAIGGADNTEVGWQDYINDEKGFTIEYPIDWDIDSALDLFMSRDFKDEVAGAKVKIQIDDVAEDTTWQDQAQSGLITSGEEETVNGKEALKETLEPNEGDNYIEMIAFPSADGTKVVTLALTCSKDDKKSYIDVYQNMVKSFSFIDNTTDEEENVNEEIEESSEEEVGAQIYSNDKFGYQLSYPADWKTYTISDARVGFLPELAEPSPEYIGDITITYTMNPDGLTMEEYYNGRHGVDLFTDTQGSIDDITVGSLSAKKFNEVIGYAVSSIVVIPVEGGFIEINDNNNQHQDDGIYDMMIDSFSL